jgi:hypothetical protein
MNKLDFEPDRIELRSIQRPTDPDGQIVVKDVTRLMLPRGAGVYALTTSSGEEVIVNMSFGKIDPEGEKPHTIVRGAAVGGEVIIFLNNGVGRKELTPESDVVFHARGLTRELEAMRRQDRRPRKGW